MNKHQASALTTGERIRWKCGNSWRAGRVLDQSLHPEAAVRGRIAVSHNSHDVSWIEPRKLHFTAGDIAGLCTINQAEGVGLGPRVIDARDRSQR